MCLIIEAKATPKRAKKDIICYKVIKRYTFSDGTENLHTPYKFAPIPKDVINGKKPFTAKTSGGATVTDKMFERCGRYFGDFGEVSKCAIHTYTTETGAIADADLLKQYYGGNFIIYKCIIPKDTLYYEGDFEGIKSFASKKIVFKKMVRVLE